jgi:hypothetical protein
METNNRELIKTNVPNKYLVVEVYYNLGGMNYFSGKSEARGYYLSVTPQTIAGGVKTFTAFTGTKMLLLEVKRQSPKSLTEAIKIAGLKKRDLILLVALNNKLEIAPVTEVK